MAMSRIIDHGLEEQSVLITKMGELTLRNACCCLYKGILKEKAFKKK